MKRLWVIALWATMGGSLFATEPFDVAIQGPHPGDPLISQGEYSAPASTGAPVLVMLHGLGSSRGEWNPLAQQAHRRGWGTLVYDLRGHGRSRGTMAGRTVNFEDPKNGRSLAFWRNLPTDLEQEAAALEKKKGVSRQKLVLVGASIGANTVLDTASRLKEIGALVLLSPGLDYAGLLTEKPMASLTSPTLMIAAQPDLYAFTSSQRLQSLAPPGLLTWKPLDKGTPRGAHGVQLFDGKLEEMILDWIAGTIKR